MKTLNGYEVVDAKARQDIAELQNIDIQDSYCLDFTAATINYTECDAEMIKCCETLINGGDACIYLKDSYDNYFYPAVATISSNRITLSKSGLNLNSVANSTPVKWDVISLILTDKWYYFKVGSNEATFVTTEGVGETVAEALSDYALKEDIPSLEGLATEEYVNTAVSSVSCITETIEIIKLTDTPQVVDSDTAMILDRIANGEKFPIGLTGTQTISFPEAITSSGTAVNMYLPLGIRATANGTYLDSVRYKFEKPNNQWLGYYYKNSYLVRSTEGNN